MLTWREKEILIFDQEFKLKRKIPQPKELKEGWGITHNVEVPNIFYISDSRNIIFECDYY